ncbi:MAG: thiol peroxidase [Deltaproteobacteria bacterium]|nr:thiol peroxidase [Deltaproteobacteria bacterium]
MRERTGIITMHGNPLTLLGSEVKAGERAPEATLLDNNLTPVKISSFRGKVVVISSVPSIDTPVCDIETRRFNKEAEGLAKDVTILTVSMDLPFAQKRWCGAAGIERVTTLSDHLDASFGTSYGMLIKELRLLARAVFIVDRDGIVRYIQQVRELTEEPDYDEIIKEIKKLA